MPTKYRGSQDEVRALSALINLLRASEAFTASLQREVSGKRLTASQFGILEALLHLGPVCQGELAGKLLRSGGSITSVVDGLEKRGLVERRRDGSDRRFVRVQLTDKGTDLIRGIFSRTTPGPSPAQFRGGSPGRGRAVGARPRTGNLGRGFAAHLRPLLPRRRRPRAARLGPALRSYARLPPSKAAASRPSPPRRAGR